MKISRRKIAAVVVGSALAVNVSAQTTTAEGTPDLAKAAREANRRNAEALAKVELPISTEPAVQFRA